MKDKEMAEKTKMAIYILQVLEETVNAVNIDELKITVYFYNCCG
jgi:hypothetical protein